MPAFSVFLQVPSLSKRLSAYLARERFIATVCSAVHCQATGAQERFATQTTEVFLFSDLLLRSLFLLVNKPKKDIVSPLRQIASREHGKNFRVVLISHLLSLTWLATLTDFLLATWLRVFRPLAQAKPEHGRHKSQRQCHMKLRLSAIISRLFHVVWPAKCALTILELICCERLENEKKKCSHLPQGGKTSNFICR